MNSTNVMVFNIYQDAFVNFRFGIALRHLSCLPSFSLTVFQFKFVEKKVHYQ